MPIAVEPWHFGVTIIIITYEMTESTLGYNKKINTLIVQI